LTTLFDEKYLSVAEAALALGCSAETVRRRIRHDEIASFKLGGKRLLSAYEVEQYVARAKCGILNEAVQ
jgi:excisionase family DNA binding protein